MTLVAEITRQVPPALESESVEVRGAWYTVRELSAGGFVDWQEWQEGDGKTASPYRRQLDFLARVVFDTHGHPLDLDDVEALPASAVGPLAAAGMRVNGLAQEKKG